MDRTIYKDKDHTPETALRQIFARQRLPEKLCLLIAETGLLSVERFAVIGEKLNDAKETFKTMLDLEDKLGSTVSEKALNLTLIAAVWKNCTVLQDHFATRRARMEEDPSKVPEIGADDHGDFRLTFTKAHPDVILNSWKEPHKRFVEKVNRDYLVHGSIPFYEIGEMRVRSDTILQKSGISSSAEQLLQISKVDEVPVVATEEEVLNRLHAFFMTLEYLNICSFSFDKGPTKYISELEEFRQDKLGLNALVKLDKLIRTKAAKYNADYRDRYPTLDRKSVV